LPIAATTIVEFETIDSTNTEAHRRALAGERGPLWIRADRQEAGRGRSGRAWASPAGNLSATYLFVHDGPSNRLHQLSFVAGLALFDAVHAACPGLDSDELPLQLKWPNDLLIGAAKVAGILVESSQYGGMTLVIIGCGVNIEVTPPVTDRPVTRLADHAPAPTPGELLGHLVRELDRRLDEWASGRGFDAIRTAWAARAHPTGTALTINAGPRGRLAGRYAGLAPSGALKLDLEDGNVIDVDHGDVVLNARDRSESDTETHA